MASNIFGAQVVGPRAIEAVIEGLTFWEVANPQTEHLSEILIQFPNEAQNLSASGLAAAELAPSRPENLASETGSLGCGEP
ncbi:hypothetical protein AND_009187 [Anopheles darlingi]|uniref:Uncharacterized protein n=1 Tax=Anopheles darlingi TaxID=43151 RepID=W5J748_ANODA|nr:hypothetical protein AND_009187 [Anopheles darlingi]